MTPLELETDWRLWLLTLFPSWITADWAPHHEDLWEWAWNIRVGVAPDPFIALWSRGHAKSSSAEAAAVALGTRGGRRYLLYVSDTQSQADDHVANIGSRLESEEIATFYPDLARREVGKYGSSRGWRRNRLRTRAGFTIDALGLDVASRGLKLEEDRPDALVLDDIDTAGDTARETDNKMRSLSRNLLPALKPEAAILAVQNLILEEGVFAKLIQGELLAGAQISGPIPAVRDLEVSQVPRANAKGEVTMMWTITGGEALWPAGMDLAQCQALMDTYGLTAFLQENQHSLEPPAGGMFDHLIYEHCTREDVPPLVRTVVWVDPAVTDTDNSDSHGVQCDGLAGDGRIYRLFSWEQRATPVRAIQVALRTALEYGAASIGIETDQGGDTWKSVYKEACEAEGITEPPRMKQAKAGAGHGAKAARAQKMLADYEHGKFVHVTGTHLTLERALRRFPRVKPFDLCDVAYWSWADLRYGVRGSVAVPPVRAIGGRR